MLSQTDCQLKERE
jgi:hypothetical protein